MANVFSPRPVRDGPSRALSRPRYEVLPLDGVENELAEGVPRDVTVTISASPSRGQDATVGLAERLARRGFRAVPHLAARQLASRSHLADILGRLDAAGVREAFVVAGDRATSRGPYHDALALLTAISQVTHRLERIGVAGYPDGHPLIDDAELIRALVEKAPFASYVVSQLCFYPAAVAGWIGRLRAAGFGLPVYVGVAGVVDRRRLLRVATKIGVGESARFLRKQHRSMARLAVTRAYRPDRMLDELVPYGIDGLHFYTFNNLRATERWRQRTLSRWEVAA